MKRKLPICLLTFLWAEITAFVFSSRLNSLLDILLGTLFGKSFSQRGVLIRIIIFTLIAAVTAAVICRVLMNRKMNSAVILFCLLICLTAVGIICADQTLRRDDYWEIRDANLYGFPGFISYEYLTFNGRYFSLFVKSLYTIFDPLVYINLLLFVNIVLLCAAFFYLMKILAPESSLSLKLSVGVCLAMGMIFASSNIWEVWFWGGGTFIYGIGITFAVWAVVLMIALETDPAHRGRKAAAAALCLFFACGTSELVTASLCLFSFMIFLLPRVLWKRKLNVSNAFLFLFTWGITVVIMLTSGNMKNAARLSGDPTFGTEPLLPKLSEIFISVPETLGRYFYSRIEYMAVFAVIVLLIGLSLPSLRMSGKALCASCVVLILGAVGALSVNVIIGFVPPRVITIPLDWIFLAIAMLMLWCGAHLRGRLSGWDGWHAAAGVAALSVLSVTALFYMNNIGMVRDIRTAWFARDRVLSALNGAEENVKTCAIPVMGSGTADPSEDPTQDFNIVTAYYYGLPSVTADHLCAPFD